MGLFLVMTAISTVGLTFLCFCYSRNCNHPGRFVPPYQKYVWQGNCIRKVLEKATISNDTRFTEVVYDLANISIGMSRTLPATIDNLSTISSSDSMEFS
ncbi:hypothetical protein TNIN_139481 [Trichonephila inaurata madagascariensis]|uniref:Uncharacterized protein n=1 Tax=Trichonephila inaurata madagascariensis TaxID=2747483 RepID=A0A8X6X2B8_9ARAC|nr:hypothetical protein TNIN_139481 [Trichonephila inaurata madagascariensis]